MINEVINKLSNHPQVFNFLRKILENNFKAHHQVISKCFPLKSNQKILDVGCGTGEFCSYFPPHTYTGIDINAQYIKFAKNHYQGRFLVADAQNLPFADSSFPKILMVGVLHHLDDQSCFKVLRETKRVLVKNGQMLIMEDIKAPEDLFVTKLIHYLDKGKLIRTRQVYEQFLNFYFKIRKVFIIRSGLCPYQVFLLERKNG